MESHRHFSFIAVTLAMGMTSMSFAGGVPDCPNPPGGGPGFQCPAGCSGNTPAVDINVSNLIAIPGQMVTFTTQVINAGPLPSRCALSGGQVVFTLPDGAIVELAGFGGMTPDVPLLLPVALLIPPSVFPEQPFEIPFTVPADAMAGGAVGRADWGCTSEVPANECIFVHTETGLNAEAATTQDLTVRVPCITIEKSANPVKICEGDPPVTYTYLVDNCGLDPLTNVELTDDDCANIEGPFGAAMDGTCDGVPQGGNLMPGQIWCYECSTELAETTVNVVDVSANAIGTDGVVVEDIFYTDTDEALVEVNANPECVIEPIDPSICAGECVELCAVGVGGRAPYTFEWSTGEIGECIMACEPGDYCASVIDDNSCVSDELCCVTVNEDEAQVEIKCVELDDGGIQLCANAVGSGDIEYDWSTGENSPCIVVSDRECVEYCVFVTDEAGCAADVCITLEPGGGGGGGSFFEFNDSITGNRQFKTLVGGQVRHRWFIEADADNYFEDFYERPPVQTYELRTAIDAVPPYSETVGNGGHIEIGQTYYASGTSSPSYFEYVDIVRADINVANINEILAGVDLFGVHRVGENGVRTPDFGDGTHYNLRIANNVDGRGGLLLASENAKDLPLNGNWVAQATMAYLDTDFAVGGAGGVFVVNETNNLSGYDDKVVSDGKLEGTNLTILWSRRTTASDGRPRVEFRFNLAAFNAQYPAYAIDPSSDEICVVFEATRGLKGGSNYLWNDKYSCNEGGTPYLDSCGQPQNIYELDTLKGCLVPPEGCVCPTSVAVLCAGDVNFDGMVDVSDLLVMLSSWGTCPGCPSDLDLDGTVNVLDLLALLSAWGPCP